MKRFLLICFVLIFLLNLMGWQWIFIHEQNLHRESAWNSIKSEKSKAAEDIIKVSDKACNSICLINSHEMVFRGRLYDVRNIKKTGGETIYYCSADNEEEQMIA